MADGGDGVEGDDDGDGKSDKTRCPQHAHLGLFKLRHKVRQVSRSPGPHQPRNRAQLVIVLDAPLSSFTSFSCLTLTGFPGSYLQVLYSNNFSQNFGQPSSTRTHLSAPALRPRHLHCQPAHAIKNNTIRAYPEHSSCQELVAGCGEPHLLTMR